MKRILFAIIAAFGLISCIGTPDLNGYWKISSVDGDDISQKQVHPFINFDKASGRFHGNSGVNIINGTYTVNGSNLKLENISTTMMAGPEDDMELESEILDAINAAKKFKGKNGSVEILDGDGDVVLTLVR